MNNLFSTVAAIKSQWASMCNKSRGIKGYIKFPRKATDPEFVEATDKTALI